MRLLSAALALALLACSCGSSAPPRDDAAAHHAHDAYTAAINSNDVDAMCAMLTDDAVFLAGHSAPFIGKDAIRPWLEGYVAAFRTHWDKKVEEFVVLSDEWAFERYSYHSVDTPKDGGDAIEDTGWGLLLYHRDADGKWRVARDSWGSDRPPQ